MKHAKLSASGSSSWMNCPGSIEAKENYAKQTSSFADEGTIAHAIADMCLENNKDASFYIGKTIGKLKIKVESFPESYAISSEMADNVQYYVDYVRSHENLTSTLYTEKRVDFSHVVPDGFGTCDSAVLDTEKRICHIFDLKYGKGVKVEAENNTQAQLYAIGFHELIGFLDEYDIFRIHICQPRLHHFVSWDITIEELQVFAKYASERAELALSENAPRIPGDKQCKFCPAKHDCPALYQLTFDTLANEFDSIETKDDIQLVKNKLTDEQRKEILDKKSLIEMFFKSVEDYAYAKLLSGDEFPGYKVVEGRSNRVYTEKAEQVLIATLGENAYNKKLIGVTDAEKKLGKEIMSEITIKPIGKPTMVPVSDKRKPMDISFDVKDLFDDMSEE